MPGNIFDVKMKTLPERERERVGGVGRGGLTVGAEKEEKRRRKMRRRRRRRRRGRGREKRGMDVVCWWGRATDRIVQMRHFDEWAEFGASGSTIKRTTKKS